MESAGCVDVAKAFDKDEWGGGGLMLVAHSRS